MTGIRWYLALFLLSPVASVRADQVEMLNGDRYVGTVQTMSADTVFVQSDVLGQLKIPRNKVSTITLGTAVNRTAAAIPTHAASATAPADASNPLQGLASRTNLVDGIRKQFLADAGPEANAKF